MYKKATIIMTKVANAPVASSPGVAVKQTVPSTASTPPINQKSKLKPRLPEALKAKLPRDKYIRAFRLVTKNILCNLLGPRYDWLQLDEIKKIVKVLAYYRIQKMQNIMIQNNFPLHGNVNDELINLFHKHKIASITTPDVPMLTPIKKHTNTTNKCPRNNVAKKATKKVKKFNK